MHLHVHVIKAGTAKATHYRYRIAAWPHPSLYIWSLSLSPPLSLSPHYIYSSRTEMGAQTERHRQIYMEARAEMKFTEFYEKWMAQLEEHLRLLLVAPSRNHQQQSGEEEFQLIVNKLTAHHKDYYKFKWSAAHEDVLAFFTPAWLSPLENAYLWITGWKPSTAFRLVESLKRARTEGGASLSGLSEEQVRGIDALRVKIKAEEERVEREMERQQVAMADRKMVELARLESAAKRNGGGEAAAVEGLVEVAVKGLLAGLERVMKMADCVRLKTMKGVLDVLSPMQCVQFLAATSMLQIQMRKWGKNRNRNKSCNQIQPFSH